MAGSIVTIRSSGQLFKADAEELCCRSAFFRAALASGMREAASKHVDLSTVPALALEVLLATLESAYLPDHPDLACSAASASSGSDVDLAPPPSSEWSSPLERGVAALGRASCAELRDVAVAVGQLQWEGLELLTKQLQHLGWRLHRAKLEVVLEWIRDPGAWPLAAMCELQQLCQLKLLDTCARRKWWWCYNLPWWWAPGVGQVAIRMEDMAGQCLTSLASAARAMNGKHAYRTVYDGSSGQKQLESLSVDVAAELGWTSALPFAGCVGGLRPVIVGGALSALYHKMGSDDVDVFFVLQRPGKILDSFGSKHSACDECDSRTLSYNLTDYTIVDVDGWKRCMKCHVQAAIEDCVSKLVEAAPHGTSWVLAENRCSISLLMDIPAVGRRHVQFVYWCYESIEDMLVTLDLPCTQLCFDGQDLWMTPECVRSLVSRDIIIGGPFNRQTARVRYSYRLAKYALTRGFRLLHPVHVDVDRPLSRKEGFGLLQRLLQAGGRVQLPKKIAGYGAVTVPVSPEEVFENMQRLPVGCALRAKPAASFAGPQSEGHESSESAERWRGVLLENRVDVIAPWTDLWERVEEVSWNRRKLVNLLRLELAVPAYGDGPVVQPKLLADFFCHWVTPEVDGTACQTDEP